MLTFFLLAAIAVTSTPSALPARSADAAMPILEPVYQVAIGRDQVIALSDGSVGRDEDALIDKSAAAGSPRMLEGATHRVQLPVNAFLIKTPSTLALVDAGGGEMLGPHPGTRVAESLKAAGYSVDQVTAVLISHCHPDHVGGLIAAGQRAYPNATVFVDQRDLEFIRNPSATTTDAARLKGLMQVRAVLDLYAAAGRLRTFSGAEQLFPDIRSIPAPGHTPGHTAYLVESQGRRLLIWGDIIHLQNVQFDRPDVAVVFDSDPTQAVVTRREQLKQAADEGYLVAGAHLDFPGLGRVRLDQGHYEWVPLRAIPNN